MAVFGMVTTALSARYTDHALRSFFRHTPLEAGDELYLIDNDSAYATPRDLEHAAIRRIPNATPRSFAENANRVLAIAAERRADLYFLNNDLVFTSGWIEPLRSAEPTVISPLSNAESPYEVPGFHARPQVALESYLGHEAEVDRIADRHRATAQGVLGVLRMPFFCVKIPFAVYSAIGALDERFGRGGAEDDDYCLRAALAGFPVCYARESWILHFAGRSTWASGESGAEISRHNERYIAAFREKWGPSLLEAFIFRNAARVFGRFDDSREAFRAGDHGRAIRCVLARERPAAGRAG